MALAGSLQIEIAMGVAKLQQDVARANGIVTSGMQSIEGMVSKASNALATLGVGLSVGALALFVRNAIDAADKLNDLSKSTGLAVETLAGLQIAAKQSGSDLDSVASSINKLSVNIGQNAEKFKALGITTKDPLEAFKQLSDIFSAIQDPQLRAALGAETLGKKWEGAAPLLAEGGAKIQEMVDKGSKLVGVTQEIAEQADAFNDKLALLVGTGGTANRIIGELLPMMNRLADDVLKVSDSTGSATDSFNPLLEILRTLIVVGGNVAFVFKGIGTEIGGMAAQIAALASGDFAAFKVIRQEMVADAEKARVAFDRWESSIMKVGTASQAAADKLDAMDQVSRRLASSQAAEGREAAEAAAKKARALLDYEKVRGRVVDDEKKRLAELKRLQELHDKGVAASIQATIDAYHEEGQIRLRNHRAFLAELERLEKAHDDSIAAGIEARIDRYYDEGRAQAAPLMAANAARTEMEKLAKTIEFETSLLGLNAEQRAKAIVLRDAELKKIGATDESLQKLLKAMDAEAGAQRLLQIRDSLTDVFLGAFESGKDAATAFWDYLKDASKKLVLRPIIQWGVSGAMGMFGFSGGASASSGGDPLGIGATLSRLFGSGRMGDSLDRSGAANRSLGDTSIVGTLERLLGDNAPLLQAIGQVAGGVAIGLGAGGAIARAIGGDDVKPLHSTIGTIVGGIIGAYWGAAGAAVGSAAGGIVGGVLDGILNEGLAGRSASVGAGNRDYTYATRGGKFGDFGIIRGTDEWFSDKDMSATLNNWFRAIGKLDAEVAKHFSVAEIERATAILGSQNPVRLDFGEEHSTLDPETFSKMIQMRYGAIFSAIDQQMADLITNFKGSGEDLISMVVDLATIHDRLTNLRASLTSVFGQSVAFSDIARLKGETEGYTEALQRLAAEYGVTNRIADMLGKTQAEVWGSIGLSSEGARARLVELAGGLDNLGKQLDFYYQNFYTTAEQQAATLRTLQQAFSDAGVAMPTTIDGFRAITDGFLAMGPAGAQAAATMLGLAPLFYQYIQAIEAVDAVIRKSGDGLASIFGEAVSLDTVRGLQENGEELTATLTRITSTFTATNQLLAIFGMRSQEVFGAFGIASEAARSKLIELSGGLDAFTTNLAGFYENYFSAEERRAMSMQSMQAQFTAWGIAMPTTIDGFRALVQQQMALGPSGASVVAGLLGMQQAFFNTHQVIVETTTGIVEAVAALRGVTGGGGGSLGGATFNPENFGLGRKPSPTSTMELPEYIAWLEKLDVLMGRRTQQEIDRERDLAGVSDDATRALINQYHAQIDANEAAQRAAEASRQAASNLADFASQMDRITGTTFYTDRQRQFENVNAMAALTAALPHITSLAQLMTILPEDFKAYSVEHQRLMLAVFRTTDAIGNLGSAVAAVGGVIWDWQANIPSTGIPTGPADNSALRQKLTMQQRIEELRGSGDMSAFYLLRALELSELPTDELRELQKVLWGLEDAAAAAAKTAEEAKRRMEAIGGLKDWLKSSLFNSSSPLTIAQQMAEARSQYSARLDLARTGDMAALGDITSFAERYQELAKQMYAGGGPFSAIWQSIRADIEGLTGAEGFGDMPATQGDTMIVDTLKEEIGDLKATVASLLEEIRDNSRDDNETVKTTIEQSGDKAERAAQRAKRSVR